MKNAPWNHENANFCESFFLLVGGLLRWGSGGWRDKANIVTEILKDIEGTNNEAIGCDQGNLVSHGLAPQLRPRLRRSVEIQSMTMKMKQNFLFHAL